MQGTVSEFHNDDSYCPLLVIVLMRCIGAYYNYSIIKMFHSMFRVCKFCPIF